MAGQSDVTTATKDSLNESLANSFDATTVNEELGAQVEITRAFDQERRKIKTELNKEEKELRDAAKEQEALGNYTARDALLEQANDIQQKSLLFDGISSALYGPNANGVTGYVARAVSPQVANQIGQYFKKNEFLNNIDNGKRPDIGSPEHLLAHAILGAAVSAATGNDALTGGISASSGEATAPLLSKYLYNITDPSELTAEQKDAITSIISLTTIITHISANGDNLNVSQMVGDVEVGKVGVEGNYLTETSLEKLKRRQLTLQEAEQLSQLLDEETERLCSSNPTGDSCRTAISSQIQYIAMQEAWTVMRNDVKRTSKQTFNYLYNTPNAENRFVIYFNTIDNRANFFAASNQYENNLGVGARWFEGAEYVSRAPWTGLGADGHASYLTFGASKILGNPDIYSWRNEAGNALITQGFGNFKNLYNNRPNSIQWDIKQLRDEQTLLQPIHEKYLRNESLFTYVSSILTDSKYTGILLDDKQTQPGGIDILDKDSRIRYGCKLLGYTEQQGCKP